MSKSSQLKWCLIIIMMGIFYSCNRKPEFHFHYSDGTEIKDSTVIQFLKKQLPICVLEYDNTESYNIQTFFDSKITQKLKHYFEEDSLRRVSAMVIIENQTGDVVYLLNSDQLFAYSRRFKNTKMYGMLMSFEKGVKLTDTFSWIGRQGKQRYERGIQSLYSITPPSIDYQYPYDYYSCNEWKEFLEKLAISTKGADCKEGYPYPRYYFSTSLFDLTKIASLIQQNGYVQANNLFGDIKDENGDIIYSPGFVKGQLLQAESCNAIVKVLKRDTSKMIIFNYPISLRTEKGNRMGMIVSTKRYTIGLLSATKFGYNSVSGKEIIDLVSLF